MKSFLGGRRAARVWKRRASNAFYIATALILLAGIAAAIANGDYGSAAFSGLLLAFLPMLRAASRA